METFRSEIVVAGGGPAGCIAAIAAARNGADVLLIEQYGCLGGMSTMGSVNPWMTFHNKQGKQTIVGIPQEVVAKLVELNASPGHVVDTMGETSTVTPFDPETLKFLLASMCLDAGVKILFHTFIIGVETCGEQVAALRLASKSGESRVQADIFIDCTGDADLAAMAGCPFEIGRPEDGMVQPGTMNFSMANVDFESVRVYMTQHHDEFHNKTRFDLLETQEPNCVSGFFTIWNKIKSEISIPILRDRFLFFKGYRGDIATVNTTRVVGIDSTKVQDLTRGELEGRFQVMEVAKRMIKYLPGFGKAYLFSTGSVIGIRESRRIVGEYVLTKEDLLAGRNFPDDVMLNAYTIDVHDPNGASFTQYEVPTYGIPLRTLLPRNIANMLVAGRSFSSTREAQGSARTTPSCMAMGQAAGTAAAVALRQGVRVKDVDIPALRDQLKKDGVCLNI